MPAVHVLKTDPELFDLTIAKKRPFELRLNDRGFKAGDELILLKTRYTGEQMKKPEFSLQYTGLYARLKVLSVTPGSAFPGLAEDWCAMGIEVVYTFNSNKNLKHYIELAQKYSEEHPKDPNAVTGEKPKSAPANRWKERGESDPFSDYLDMERAHLCMGNYTDDELANEVFMHDHRNEDIMALHRAGKPTSIAILTAAKERIRWLSRHLKKTLAELKVKPAIEVPEGWMMVPKDIPEEQWGGLARSMVAWIRMTERQTPNSFYKHYTRMVGNNLPEWLQKEIDFHGGIDSEHVLPKGTVAVWIYKAMLEDAPKYEPVPTVFGTISNDSYIALPTLGQLTDGTEKPVPSDDHVLNDNEDQTGFIHPKSQREEYP